MVNDQKRDGRADVLRLALLAAFVVPLFTACPPSRPLIIPYEPPSPQEEPLPQPEAAPQPAQEIPSPAKEEERTGEPVTAAPADYESVHSLVVPGNEAWVDAGLEAEEGRRIFFQVEGVLSLQKGNPTAICGPDGYKLRTVQQPMPDQNIGALIGRLVHVLSVDKDPETGKEIRNEQVEVFFIGRGGTVTLPGKGRLYLGVNEQVVGDNDGAYTVTFYLLK